MQFRHFFVSLFMILPLSTVFSENLYDIYRDAVNNDFLMKSAKAKLRVDVEAYEQAVAQYLPQVGLSAGMTKGQQTDKRCCTPDISDRFDDPDIKNLVNAFIPANQSDANQTTYQWNLVVKQELVNMGYWYGIQSAKHNNKIAELDFFKAQQSLIIRSTEAYLGVLRAQNNLESSIAEENAFKQQLDQTRQRFKVGLVANTDVQQAQAAYDLATVRRINDEGMLQTSFEALIVLTGKRYQFIAPFVKDMPVTMPEPLDRESWVRMALTNNPDLNIKRAISESANYNAKAASAARYPTLNLSANYGRSHVSSDINDNIQNDAIALSVQVPIYTGGQVSSKIREGYARLDFAKDDLRFTERQTEQQIRSAHIDTATTIHTVKARQQAIISAQSSLDAVRAGYEYGTRNIVDLLQAQQSLYSAKRDYGNSRYDYILSVINLKQISGSLTPEDIIAFNRWITQRASSTKGF